MLLLSRTSLSAGAAALLSFAAACGGGGSADGPSDPPTGPPNQPTTFTLTVTSRSADGLADTGPLWVYVGDLAETRARMPAIGLFESAPEVRPTPAVPSVTRTFTVPRGKIVTIFAGELAGPGLNGRATIQSALVKQTPNSAVEFKSWIGAQGQPEPGVAVVTMNSDLTVIAEYARMQGFAMTMFGCPAFKLASITNAFALGFGGLLSYNQTNTANIGQRAWIATTDDDYAYFFGKQGTVFTFEALKRESRTPPVAETGFIRWTNPAGGCGSALSCAMAVPPAGTPVLKLDASYVLPTAGGVIGCGACNGTGGACDDFISRMRP
jgi:hypothetical protein